MVETNFPAQPKTLSNFKLVQELKDLTASERKVTAEIIEYIKEVDRRKLYLELGHTSLFAFLTKELKYTPASAQRRIDAARISRDLPELKQSLESGDLNLTQISIVAQGLRQNKKLSPKNLGVEKKREIFQQLRSQTLEQTQVLVAQKLNLEVKTEERKRFQQDGSVRHEITFTSEQWARLQRAKEVISHLNSDPSLAELIDVLAKELLKKRDLAVRKESTTTRQKVSAKQEDPIAKYGMHSSEDVCTTRSNSAFSKRNKVSQTSAAEAVPSQSRQYIPLKVRRFIFQRDQRCQWRDAKTKSICGSRFQLEIDHIQPVWSGGNDTTENLRLLCSAHNKFKYRIETRTTTVSERQIQYEKRLSITTLEKIFEHERQALTSKKIAEHERQALTSKKIVESTQFLSPKSPFSLTNVA